MTIIDRFRALRIDLQKHLLFGLAIAFVATVATGVAGSYVIAERAALVVVAGLAGFSVGRLAGWLKEYYWDARGHGVVDRDDYLYTGRGAVIGAVLGAVTVALLWT